MIDAAIGRLLVASLHQGIADLMPTRLEFYEGWLSPTGLRDGRIGLAPLAAALSFLRLEGEPYSLVARRAGEYAADWMVAELPPFRRNLIRAVPPRIRLLFVTRTVRAFVRDTYTGSRAMVRWQRGRAVVDLRGSIFCEVREPVRQPLCDYYAAAIRRLMYLFNLEVDVATSQCRGTGAAHCLLTIEMR